MIDRQTAKLMQEEARFFGIDQGYKEYKMVPFSGMDQSNTSRVDNKDTDAWWQENLIKVGPGTLRSLWDKGATLYTAPGGETIIYYFFFNIGAVNYVAVFLSDGTAYQIKTSDGSSTTISAVANTFYNSGISTQIPVCGQWGAEFLLIANNFSANLYWIWDGSNLYTVGTLGPLPTITNVGSGYTSAPTVAAYGGNGSGATFTATISSGNVVQLQVTNPGSGYQPGDIVQLRFSGGGSDDAAQLTAVLTAGAVTSVVVTNVGSGYTPGTYSLGFSGGGGINAAGTYTVGGGGTVTSTNITNGGSGYTGSPTVSFPSGGGSNASGIALISAGSITSVTVTHGGSGFTGTPTLTIVGGGGSGAVLTAVLTTGAISSVTVNNGGSNYTSTPAIEVQTGINRAAAATITLMPYGVSGSSIETFQSRVWLGFPFQTGSFQVSGFHNGDVILVSAPSSPSDFATSDGGLSFANSDSFLKAQYINLKQSNGYLYPIADSSVSVISNVQTAGSPPTTTFNYQNTDPQTGASWRDTVQPFSRTILLANPFGVYGLYGGAVTKVSKQMDNIFNNAVFPAAGGVTPSSAVANIYGNKIYLINLTVIDPFTNASRTLMLAWNEKEWVVASQSLSLTFIATQEVSSNLTAWGTDGNTLFPLFSVPSASLNKKLSSKLFGDNKFLIQEQAIGAYMQVQDLSVGATGVSLSSFSIDTEHGSYAIPALPTFGSCAPPYYSIQSFGTGHITGDNIGFTLNSISQDFTINYISLGYIEISSIALSSTSITGTITTSE